MAGKYLSQSTRQQCRDLYKAGMKISRIAKELHISPSSASRHAHAAGSTACKPKSGRPRKLSPQNIRVVRRLSKGEHGTDYIAEHLASRHGVNVDRTTVARVLRTSKKPIQWLPVIRGRRLSLANKMKRVAFCQQSKTTKWRKTIFIDSKFLYVYKSQSKGWLYKWQEPNKREVVSQHSNPFVFHFYAAVGQDFKSSLVYVPPTRGEGVDDPMDKTSFKSQHFLGAIEKLKLEIEEGFSGRGGYKVVLDHAKQHTSKQSKEGMDTLALPILERFPPQSWDLNAIEVCWAWLDQNLRGHKPRTWDGWKRAIEHAWDEVQMSSINKLVKRVPRQVDKIIEANGEWCKYFP